MVEEDKFFAWLDGELEAEEAARVEAAVAADPELSRRADEHRALAANLRGAFASVAAAPIPARVADALREDNVVDLAQARDARRPRGWTPFWSQAAALAATLAIGVFTGTMLGGGQSEPVRTEDSQLVAGGELKQALSSQLASAPAEHGPRILLTYRDKSGAICRTFSTDNASGLACHQSGDWRIRGLFQNAEGQSSDYRMAAGADPRLMDMVDESIAGEPFDAAQEKAGLARDWR